MSKHAPYLEGYEDPKRLARDLENLRYDYVARFLWELARAFELRAVEDAHVDKWRLAYSLEDVADYLEEAAEHLDGAWGICAPHMEKNNE